MVQIDTDVPFTAPHRYTNLPRKWPWTKMKPGDSFTVTTYATMASARNSFRMHCRTVHNKTPSSWFVATKKISGNRLDGVYRLWLLDKNLLTTC